MFISIPEEFFVPVKYDSTKNLNLEEANICRSNGRENKGKVESGTENVKKNKKDISEETKNKLSYVDIDDEYIDYATNNKK